MAERYLVTLTDPSQREFFEELIGHFDFLQLEGPDSKPKRTWTKKEREFMEGLRGSIQEMKDDLSGKHYRKNVSERPSAC